MVKSPKFAHLARIFILYLPLEPNRYLKLKSCVQGMMLRTEVIKKNFHENSVLCLPARCLKRMTQRVPSVIRNSVPEDRTGTLQTTALQKTFYRRTGALFLQPRVPLSSVYDREIWILFAPAVIALVLEPVQMAIETAIVGQLGVSPLGAVGFGTVLFQFALGCFSALIFATTPLVAAKMSANDARGASRAAADGMWVAFFLGIILQAVVWLIAPDLLNALSSDTEVAGLATSYLRGRSWGIPAALVMMVAIGAARGHRDMAAPLVGSLVYGIALAVFDAAFVFGAGAGVDGAGVAASLSQWMGAAALIGWLVKEGEFNLDDLKTLPNIDAAQPYLHMGPSLAVNSIAALAPMLAATSLATSLGPNALAAHTVLRQLSGFWLQGFLAFNATAHSLVASALGDVRRRAGMDRASGALERICQLAVASSVPAVFLLLTLRSVLPQMFTSESTVIEEVALVLPFLLAYMPFDALGTSLEGGILGASDTKWVATRTALSSGASLAALLISFGGGKGGGGQGLLATWLSLKLLNISALGLDLQHFMGPIAQRTVSGRSFSASRRQD
jgi:putative MATE family efflux protein